MTNMTDMTDKYSSGLIHFYEDLFKDLKNKPITLLELGILKGDSLLYWDKYFSNSKIIGLDHRLPKIELPQNIEVIQGWQNDIPLLQKLGNEKGPFDIIVDDCSHYGTLTQISFDFLFKHLKNGGYYIIEDFMAGFNHPEFRGIDDVICVCMKNFNNYKLQEIRALKLPQGGSVAVIKKSIC